jgi:glycosyltransferase involved in cell wall biosynthesis
MPDEVIIVVDGSIDGTAAFLREQKFALTALRIIEQENGGRAKVRNTGAKAAQGDLLIFFDDDMRLLPDCIEQHSLFHKKNHGAILTGGTKEEVLSNSSDLFCFKSSLSDQWNRQLIQYFDSPMPKGFSFITAANFSISKDTWLLLNGFDERLSDAEDYDLAVRAAHLSIPMYYNINALAWHDDVISCRKYIKRLREYREAQMYLQKIKPELYPPSHKYAVNVPTGLKSIFFKLFCFSFWIDSVDSNTWKYILPQKIRYKLYDFILTANASFYPHKVAL